MLRKPRWLPCSRGVSSKVVFMFRGRTHFEHMHRNVLPASERSPTPAFLNPFHLACYPGAENVKRRLAGRRLAGHRSLRKHGNNDVSYQYAPFRIRIINPTDRDATDVIDGLLYNKSELKTEELKPPTMHKCNNHTGNFKEFLAAIWQPKPSFLGNI
jgi:hypothetical protein